MRKILFISLAILTFATAATVAAIYWTSQQQIQESVRVMKRAVTKGFHDPESVRFRSIELQSMEGRITQRLTMIDAKLLWESTSSEVLSIFRYDPEGLELCGEVNAKNAFGAYVGYKRFYVSGRKDPVPFIDSRKNDDFAKRMCEIGKEGLVFSEPDSE